ncbi:MAG: SMP-30/gluconolactonase/LRE family protein [Acidimicrobiia bacterium]|nr:SMP-30/gluconolactonase/LRE family protein [Acidimicrobiia bacterium]
MIPSKQHPATPVRLALLSLLPLLLISCAGEQLENWKARNAEVVKKNNIKGRERKVPTTEVKLKQEPGKVYESQQLPKITIAPGVTATAAWGAGSLLELLEMEKESAYPEQTLNEELITVVQEGSGTYTVGDKTLELTKDSVLYLTPGTKRGIKAGPNGLKSIEVFSPARLDHLNLAGAGMPETAKVGFPDQGVTPSLEPGKVHNLNEVQWTAITKPDPSQPYKQSHAHSRLVWGKNAMLSFVKMDPKSTFPLHIHPEDQLMICLRGSMEEGLIDARFPMDGTKRHVVLQPGGMAHSGHLSEYGAEALDVFWPVRPDYIEFYEKQNARYREVIAPGTQPAKVAEGFTFSEGPTWLKGNLYFSDMHFRDHRKGDWSSDLKRSRTIRMAPDGKWKAMLQGMQTNGTIASKGGNLLVCDMFGHRVIEVDPSSGRVLKTVLDKVDGKAVDGPNDLVMDLKGGLYVTDPQFTPDKTKSMPGTQVYYVPPDGKPKVVIGAGEYAMPNGIEISPDGKTFYVNNTWKTPGENFVWAYDVSEDGALSNKRKFAKLALTPDVLSKPDPSDRFNSQADGMTVDTDGRLYVSTLSGVQIFDAKGETVGTIWCPQFPVSCTFGGPNYDVLYMVGESSAWSIQTKVKGFRVPEGMN